VVRRMAAADHGRGVSSPRWHRAASKLTASCQRWTNQARICAGLATGSVQSSAWGAKRPLGARIRPQRRDTGGSPLGCQTAGAAAPSTVRGPVSYHGPTVRAVPVVRGSTATAARVGGRAPVRRGRPIWPGRRGGAGA